MRAKVAKHAGGHALEKRFLDLSEIELALLYMQASKEEKDKKTENFEVIKTLNEVWTKKLDRHFDMLQLFIDPKMYKQKMQMKDMEVHKKEIDENNFHEEWDKLMEYIPDTYIIDEDDATEALAADVDPEFDEMLAGWVQTDRFKRE